MEPIDVAALACAVFAFALFLASSTSLRFRETRRGAVKLAGATLFLLAAAGNGALSVGIDGYRTLSEGEPVLLVAVGADPLPGDSLRLRLVGPDRRPRVTRIAGRGAELDVRVIRWGGLSWWVGREVSWELAAVRGLPTTGSEGRVPDRGIVASEIRLTPERPIDAFGALAGWPGLGLVVDARVHRLGLDGGPGRFEVRWAPAGPVVERAPRGAGTERRSVGTPATRGAPEMRNERAGIP